MDKKKIIIIAIASILVLSILTVCCCGGSKKAPATKSKEEKSSSELSTDQLTEDDNLETTEVEDATSNSETITDSLVSEEETTKPSDKEVETTNSAYTYKDMNKVMYAKSSVNVRTLPSTEGDRLGSLQTGKEVKVTGQCNETSWYRIEYDGKVAYVSNSYLVSEKPAETATKSSNNYTETPQNNGGASTTKNFEKYTAADKVGDGLDSYRVGQFKYGVSGNKLHVAVVDKDNRYGFYYGTDDYSLEWNNLSVELQGLISDNIFKLDSVEEDGIFTSRDTYYPEFELELENEHFETEYPYNEGFMYYSTLFGPEETVNYDFVYMDNAKEVGDVLVYGLVMGLHTNHYVSHNFSHYEDTRLYKGTETLEDILRIEGLTYAQYSNGEKLAKKYGIDFHGYVKSVGKITEENKAFNKQYGLE